MGSSFEGLRANIEAHPHGRKMPRSKSAYHHIPRVEPVSEVDGMVATHGVFREIFIAVKNGNYGRRRRNLLWLLRSILCRVNSNRMIVIVIGKDV